MKKQRRRKKGKLSRKRVFKEISWKDFPQERKKRMRKREKEKVRQVDRKVRLRRKETWNGL